jgi:ABC-type transporter Mla subunit MlaD
LSDDKQPRVIVTSDGGGNRGTLVALVVLVIAIAAAVWFFNQSEAGTPTTEVTVELPTGEVDPGTETTIAP